MTTHSVTRALTIVLAAAAVLLGVLVGPAGDPVEATAFGCVREPASSSTILIVDCGGTDSGDQFAAVAKCYSTLYGTYYRQGGWVYAWGNWESTAICERSRSVVASWKVVTRG